VLTAFHIKDDNMRVFSRIGLVSATAFVEFLATPLLAQQAPSRHSVVCAATSHPFNIADAAGHYLAVHFLNATNDRAAKHVNEYLRNRPLVADVRHVFIRADESATVKDWVAQFQDHAGSVFIDADAALAKDLKVAALAPTTILFDTQGTELFRQVGTSPDDYLAWASFAGRVAEKTRATVLKDYNLSAARPLAVQGYDVVSYFKAGKAVKGNREIASSYRGVTYQFATEDDRKLFAADPGKYLPTYGGWCASAMGAKGTKVEIDPTNFKIKDGRLHLFYKDIFSDALKDWNKHEKEWEPAADANWKKLTGESPVKPTK
jgi:YHS domain-containing protein